VSRASLEACYAKLGRAEYHINVLREEVAAEGKKVALRTEFDSEELGSTICRRKVVSVPTFSDRLSLIASDAIHNLRCALDCLAYELVALDNKGVYWDKAQFPIADSVERLSRRDRGTLKLLSAPHRAFVESVQPYSTGSRPAHWKPGKKLGPHFEKWATSFEDPLRVLRELSNKDKHGLLLETAMGVETDSPAKWHVKAIRGSQIQPGMVVLSIPATLYPGAELIWARVDITDSDPQVEMNVEFTPFVSFRKYGSVEKALDLIGAKVAQVVGQFQPSFR
jgi:hypothetical protein